jgi:peptide/nickel transport system permease protein
MATTATPAGPRASDRERARGGRLSWSLLQLVKVRGAGFGLAAVLFVLGLAALPEVIAPFDPNGPQGAILLPPGREFWFGTDHLGRDVLSRVIHGARVAVQAGLVSVGFADTPVVTTGLIGG